jgi:hypothetical protein
MQGLRWIQPPAIAEGFGNHIAAAIPALFHLAGGEEQQLNR